MDKTNKIGEKIIINYEENRAIGYAIDTDEIKEMFGILGHRNLIIVSNYNNFGHIKLTYDGINYAQKISKEISTSNIAFVAMWFADEMESVYKNAIMPAIEDKSNYNFLAFRVDKNEHNNDICDEIIANIKKCKFMIADFTGNRAGVYYEAGYARGLGIPVIHTCRADWFNSDSKSNRKVHFDLEHMNFIIWENEEELKEKLVNRIKATIN